MLAKPRIKPKERLLEPLSCGSFKILSILHEIFPLSRILWHTCIFCTVPPHAYFLNEEGGRASLYIYKCAVYPHCLPYQSYHHNRHLFCCVAKDFVDVVSMYIHVLINVVSICIPVSHTVKFLAFLCPTLWVWPFQVHLWGM